MRKGCGEVAARLRTLAKSTPARRPVPVCTSGTLEAKWVSTCSGTLSLGCVLERSHRCNRVKGHLTDRSAVILHVQVKVHVSVTSWFTWHRRSTSTASSFVESVLIGASVAVINMTSYVLLPLVDNYPAPAADGLSVKPKSFTPNVRQYRAFQQQ